MDYGKPLIYRSLDINSVTIDPSEQETTRRSGRLAGIAVDDFIVGAVQGVGYTEKRSNADGRDASDVFLDDRRLIAIGTVYGDTAADAHDRFQQLCSIVSPTGAYNADPGSYGYLPLAWYEPTNDPRFDADADGNRWRTVFVNARPLLIPERRWTRDKTGGRRNAGLSIPFTAYWEAIDPRIYFDPYFTHDLEHAAGTIDGTFLNRGDYPSPLNVLLVIAAGAATGTVTITAGGAVMVITVPDADNEQIIRYNGSTHVLTVEENTLEVQRQDLLTWTTEVEHPLIDPTPLGDAEAAWQVVTTVALQANSRLWFHEAWA